MKRPLLLLGVLAGVVFGAFPGLDLWTSGLFYEVPGGFHLRDAWWAIAVYEAIPIVAIVVGAGCLLLLVLGCFRRRRVGPLSGRFLLFVLAALALGPGLAVNVGLKDHWGRARPRDVAEFGGVRRFTPALVPTDQCERNCSFVAGHPSVMFWLGAFGFVAATARRRRRIFLAAAASGLIVGFVRIVQGGHFASDVIFSGLVVFAVNSILARYVFHLPGPTEPESAAPRVA